MLHFIRVPVIAWLVVLLAIAGGSYYYYTAPMGIFLYTPRNWCAPRSHSFSVAYQLVLAAALVLLLLRGTLVTVMGVLSRESGARERIALNLRFTAICIVLLLLAALATPVFERLLPLKPDPKCTPGYPSKAQPPARQNSA